MKKPENTISEDKLKFRGIAQQKKARAAEASLEARQVRATKAIAIGSAALGFITLGLFAFKKLNKKKSFFS